jgi:hypothetical protein
MSVMATAANRYTGSVVGGCLADLAGFNAGLRLRVGPLQIIG